MNNGSMSKREMLFKKKRRAPTGSSPGTLVIDSASPMPVIRVMSYNQNGMEEKEIESVEALGSYMEFRKDFVNWIDVQGLGDERILREISELFAIHPLALEDVTNVPQQPKVDDFSDQSFIVLRMFRITEIRQIDSEQVSLFMGKDYVLTFQERYGDCLNPVRQRLRKGRGIIRTMGSDYLAYAIIDTIVDNYLPVLEELGERLEDLEDQVVSRATESELKSLYELKHELVGVKRILWPSREMISKLINFEQSSISDKVKLYLRDTYDHIVQAIDLVETYRELSSELMSVYLSSLSNKMNEIMKVLTIISTIFIPLSFIAGLYGMNFVNMPELSFKYGYFIVLGVMLGTVYAMLSFFRRRNWLGSIRKKGPFDKENY